MINKYYSKINITNHETEQIILNNEKYEEMIKEHLIYQLILQADEEVRINKKYNSEEGTTEYRIELALLDFEEYDKLKWIEKEYNRLIIK